MLSCRLASKCVRQASLSTTENEVELSSGNVFHVHSGSAVNPSSVSSLIWSSTTLFSGVHVFGFEASFTSQNNWKIRLFPKPVRKIAITSRPEIRASNASLCYFEKYRFSFREVQISQFRKVQVFISQSKGFHFAKYRFSFRKLKIFISQSTDFISFVLFRKVPFCKVQ